MEWFAGSGVSYYIAVEADLILANVFFLDLALLSYCAIALVLLMISCCLGVTPIFIMLLELPLSRDSDGVAEPLPAIYSYNFDADPMTLFVGD